MEIRENCEIQYAFSTDQRDQYGPVFAETLSDDDQIESLSQIQLAAAIIHHEPTAVVDCKSYQYIDALDPMNTIDWILWTNNVWTGTKFQTSYEDALGQVQRDLQKIQKITPAPDLTPPQLVQRTKMLQRATFLLSDGIRLKSQGDLVSAYLRELDAKAMLQVVRGQNCSVASGN